MEPTTLLDRRVPQPADYDAYGVPPIIAAACDELYRLRNSCADDDVETLDQAILRLLSPWVRDRKG